MQRGVVQRRAQVAAVQRRALAADVRQPHRQVARRDGGDGVGSTSPTQRLTRSSHKPAGVRRAADHQLAARRVRDRPQSVGAFASSSITPHVISVVPHNTSTSPVLSAPAQSCSPNASIVPRADERAVGRRPDRARSPATIVGSCADRSRPLPWPAPRPTRRSCAAGAPSSPSTSRWRRRRTARGWRRPAPARTRRRRACAPRATPGTRAVRRCRRVGSVLHAVALAAPVAVQQARSEGRARRSPTAPSDGTIADTFDRRDVESLRHRRVARRRTLARHATSMSCSNAPGSGVLTPWGRRARASTVAVAVDRDRLDRGRADVEPDRDVRHLRSMSALGRI